VTSPRVRVDDIGTVDEIRLNRLAPLLDTIDKAANAIQQAEVPKLGDFEDGQKSVHDHQAVIDDLGTKVQNLMWELMAVVDRNEEVMAAFRNGIEVDTALLSRMLDPDLLAIEADARDAGATGAAGAVGA
jgi:hypothetical protein